MQIESEPKLGKKVSLPELGIETTLPMDFDLVIKGEVPSLYERTRVIRGLAPFGEIPPIVFERPKKPLPESESFIIRLIEFVERVRDSINRTLNRAMDAVEDAMRSDFDPFSDADQNTAHGFMHKRPDGRTLYEIAYRQGLDSNMKLFAMGHEYGELLQNIDNRKDLQLALDSENIKIDSAQYRGEDYADLAGFLALYRAKKAGDETIRIPFFRTNFENRENMGRLFGLEPSIGPRPKPRGQ